jgi:polysaccharide biosynthesis/export protein
MSLKFVRILCTGLVVLTPLAASAQRQPSSSPAASPVSAVAPAAVDLPRDYVIGSDDVLEIKFWKDDVLSREVIVRPDGKISLQLLNELQAAGLTPEQLRGAIVAEAKSIMEEPSVAVIVKQINSRRVFITGQVEKPGVYPLTSATTVLQLISLAGGLKEFAKEKQIVVMRSEGASPLAYSFNYEEVRKGRKLTQNIALKPGDTVVVP